MLVATASSVPNVQLYKRPVASPGRLSEVAVPLAWCRAVPEVFDRPAIWSNCTQLPGASVQQGHGAEKLSKYYGYRA